MGTIVTGYDLWDRFDGNAIADFDDLDAALAFIRGAIEDDGPESIHRMALCEVTDEGRTSRVLAQGGALVDFVTTKSAGR